MSGPNPLQEGLLVVDQFLHPNTFAQIPAELAGLRDWKQEIDHFGAKPVGVTCDLPASSMIYRALTEELAKLFARPFRVDRFYVNRFQPREVPQFHQDGEVLTCLLYGDARDWHPDDFGETQVLVGGEIRGILPIPNRMLVFDGMLLHRATSYQTRVRHTIACKLEDVGFQDIVVPS